jgi:hypothetical protein
MIERICSRCGKNFIPAPQHVFVDGRAIYCSWTCFNRRNDNKKKKKKNYVELYTESGFLLKRFPSAEDAAEITGCCVKKIRNACKTGEPYKGFLWKYKE